MPRQSEIDRMLVLIYRSNNAHDFINFSRPYGWLDELPMVGLDELKSILEGMASDVSAEMDKRIQDGVPKYSREHHGQKQGNPTQ